MQILLMNEALTGGRATFGVPLFNVSIILLTILLDGFFFRVFECMPTSEVQKFFGFLTLTVLVHRH